MNIYTVSDIRRRNTTLDVEAEPSKSSTSKYLVSCDGDIAPPIVFSLQQLNLGIEVQVANAMCSIGRSICSLPLSCETG